MAIVLTWRNIAIALIDLGLTQFPMSVMAFHEKAGRSQVGSSLDKLALPAPGGASVLVASGMEKGRSPPWSPA